MFSFTSNLLTVGFFSRQIIKTCWQEILAILTLAHDDTEGRDFQAFSLSGDFLRLIAAPDVLSGFC